MTKNHDTIRCYQATLSSEIKCVWQHPHEDFMRNFHVHNRQLIELSDVMFRYDFIMIYSPHIITVLNRDSIIHPESIITV